MVAGLLAYILTGDSFARGHANVLKEVIVKANLKWNPISEEISSATTNAQLDIILAKYLNTCDNRKLSIPSLLDAFKDAIQRYEVIEKSKTGPHTAFANLAKSMIEVVCKTIEDEMLETLVSKFGEKKTTVEVVWSVGGITT